MNSKVMVTGARGWLGSKLVRMLLSERRKIVYVDFWKNNISIEKYLRGHKNLKIINGDIRNPEQFRKEFDGCRTVFNCAGMQHPRFTHDMYSINGDAPLRLLRECIQAKVSTFVHISSSTVHGNNTFGLITEKTPFRPITHYAISKAQGERLLSNIGKKIKTKTVVIRPGVFYGKNPSRNLVSLIENIKKGRALIFSKNGLLRTYVDIDKVVDAILIAEKIGKNGEAYLIGDKKPLNTLQFYKELAKAVNVNLKIVRLPLIVSRVCEKTSYISGKLDIHQRILNIVGEFGRNHFFSSEKAIRELSFKPHLSPENGLKEMVGSVWKES